MADIGESVLFSIDLRNEQGCSRHYFAFFSLLLDHACLPKLACADPQLISGRSGF
jgi:hypothetical protein